MKNLIFLVLLGTFAVAGCTSVKVTSEKNSNYTERISDVLVITEMLSSQRRFHDALNTQISESLTDGNVTHEVFKVAVENEDSVSTLSELLEGKSQSKILYITQRGLETSGDIFGVAHNFTSGGFGFGSTGITKNYELDCMLIDIEVSQEGVWKAKVRTTGDEYTSKEREGRDTAKKILKKLIEDQLLTDSVFPSN